MAVASKVVVDANVIAALALPLPYSQGCRQLFQDWQQDRVLILAPILLQYEFSTVLRKAVALGLVEDQAAGAMLTHMLDLGIDYRAPTKKLHQRALAWAGRLGQAKTYDAHYLALAEDESADMWTADQRLANNVRQHQSVRIHTVGEMA